MKRIGLPGDVAAAASASPRTTPDGWRGEVLAVDGGPALDGEHQVCLLLTPAGSLGYGPITGGRS